MPPVAVLDIGTTKTCALIAESAGNETLRVLGAGIVPSRGMRKGVVTDVREAAQAISAAVEQAERVAGLAVEGMYVGIAGAHIQSTNSRGVAPIRGGHGVTQEDVHRAIEAAEAIAVPANRDIVHSIPRGYTLDGQDGIKDPVGMVGHRLEIEAHIVTGAVASIQNLIRAVEEAGVKTIDLVLEPIAAGGAILTSAEREMGVVLVDIGGGTTDIAVFIDGSVWHTVILPTGGTHVTNDLAIGLRAPFLAAEEMKLKYGHVDPSLIDEDEVLEVAAFGENGKSTVSRRHMTEIIRARVEEILRLVLIEVKRSGYDNLLPAGVVLSGGASQLAGMTSFAHDILQLPVRLGAPEDLEGFADRISTPAFAATVGLAKWGLTHVDQLVKGASRKARVRPDPSAGIFGWARKAFLPESNG